MAIGCLASPLVGAIADRWIPGERVLMVSNLLTAILLFFAARQTDPGILFVLPSEDEWRFHMSNVLFDLDIAFFDAAGDLVGKSLMDANATALYTAKDPFQYALELPAGMLEQLGIDDGAKLELP